MFFLACISAEELQKGTTTKEPVVPQSDIIVEKQIVDVNCETLPDESRARLARAAKGCRTDSDCRNILAFCPVGCSFPIVKNNDLSFLRVDQDSYEAKCESCKQKCPIATTPSCVKGICVNQGD